MIQEKVTKAKGWPLSQDECKAAQKILIPHISFTKIMQKYSTQVEEVGSASFTHKCICPNPRHKDGKERTPSFYFSEEDKGFRCFGCGFTGNVFDIIGIIQGMPSYEVVRKLLEKNQIDLANVDLDLSEVTTQNFMQYASDINLELGIALRDYLKAFKSTEKYNAEKTWVDSMFRKIDDRFSKIPEGDKVAVREFEVQIMLELERRKTKSKSKVCG